MRKIYLFMNITIDGYFEGEGHDISFFKGDDIDNSFFKEQSGESSTILLGHRTYDLMKSYWPTDEAKKADPEIAKFMNEMPKIAAARKPFEPGWNNVTVISGDIPAEVKKFKEQSGNSIVILGSNNLCVSLMKEKLVDEFHLMVNPLVLGSGTSLFNGLNSQESLKLMKIREFKSGNILLTYKS
jgi:dihydrofolate reductase